jgi:hypothetical protein
MVSMQMCFQFGIFFCRNFSHSTTSTVIIATGILVILIALNYNAYCLISNQKLGLLIFHRKLMRQKLCTVSYNHLIVVWTLVDTDKLFQVYDVPTWPSNVLTTKDTGCFHATCIVDCWYITWWTNRALTIVLTRSKIMNLSWMLLSMRCQQWQGSRVWCHCMFLVYLLW